VALLVAARIAHDQLLQVEIADRRDDATGGRELFFEHSDGRIVLIYPLAGRVLVGTTDLEHDMVEPRVCTDAEVDYFLGLIGHVLPGVPVSREQIVYRYAGVRPLPGHGDLAPGFVSRDYRVEASRMPGDVVLLSLVGGKWTTFRSSAEHLADRALQALATPRRRSTRGVAIGGGRGYPTTERTRQQWLADHGTGVGVARAGTLLSRYGTVAADVIAAIVADPDDRMLQTVPGYSTGELRHLARTEAVHHLEDLLMRRTTIAFTGRVTAASAREVAEAVAALLEWDVDAEVARALAAVHAAVPVAS